MANGIDYSSETPRSAYLHFNFDSRAISAEILDSFINVEYKDKTLFIDGKEIKVDLVDIVESYEVVNYLSEHEDQNELIARMKNSVSFGKVNKPSTSIDKILKMINDNYLIEIKFIKLLDSLDKNTFEQELSDYSEFKQSEIQSIDKIFSLLEKINLFKNDYPDIEKLINSLLTKIIIFLIDNNQQFNYNLKKYISAKTSYKTQVETIINLTTKIYNLSKLNKLFIEIFEHKILNFLADVFANFETIIKIELKAEYEQVINNIINQLKLSYCENEKNLFINDKQIDDDVFNDYQRNGISIILKDENNYSWKNPLVADTERAQKDLIKQRVTLLRNKVNELLLNHGVDDQQAIVNAILYETTQANAGFCCTILWNTVSIILGNNLPPSYEIVIISKSTKRFTTNIHITNNKVNVSNCISCPIYIKNDSKIELLLGTIQITTNLSYNIENKTMPLLEDIDIKMQLTDNKAN